MHDVFYASKLKPAIGFIPGLYRVTLFAFQPPEEDSGKFEVEDILDSCFVSYGYHYIEEFLAKWHGYDFFKAGWEPLVNIMNFLNMLFLFYV